MDSLYFKVNEYSPVDVGSLKEAAARGEAKLLKEFKFDLGFLGYLRDACGIRPNIGEMANTAKAELAVMEGYSGQGSTYKELNGATVRFYRREGQGDTLVEQLRKLESFEEYAQKLQVDIKDDKVARKQQVLHNFYQENPLAQEVTDGKTSYVQLIQPMCDRFGSFWKRVTTPNIEPEYDSEIGRVLGSMKNVGVSHFYINVLTTQFRNTSIRSGDFTAVTLGAVSGGATVMVTDDGFFAVATAALIVGTPILWRALNAFMDKDSLSSLKEAAQKTDEFLHKNQL